MKKCVVFEKIGKDQQSTNDHFEITISIFCNTYLIRHLQTICYLNIGLYIYIYIYSIKDRHFKHHNIAGGQIVCFLLY